MLHRTHFALAVVVTIAHGGHLSAQTPERRTARDHYQRGWALVNQEDYDKAIASLDEAIRLDPTLANAYLSRGVAWSCKAEYDKAIADYDQHIALVPSSYLGLTNRGTVWFRKHDYTKALADFNRALRISPTYSFAHLGRGNVRTIQERFDEAIHEYDEAIGSQSNLATAFVNRGYVHERRREFDQAVADYKEALVVDHADKFKSHKYAHWNLAWIMATCPEAKFRDGEKAVVHATRACELSDWSNGLMVTTLAAAYAESGDFTGAIEWERQALQYLPESDAEYPRAEQRFELYRNKQPYRDVTQGPIRFE